MPDIHRMIGVTGWTGETKNYYDEGPQVQEEEAMLPSLPA